MLVGTHFAYHMPHMLALTSQFSMLVSTHFAFLDENENHSHLDLKSEVGKGLFNSVRAGFPMTIPPIF